MSASPSVVWDGLELNPLSAAQSGFLPVVESVDGWFDTPPYDGRNAPLVLADGAMRGPKTAGPREITVTGVASGPRADLAAFRDALVMRAASGAPAALSIPDPAGRLMTAAVRADTDGLKHTFRGSHAFRYQLTVTAVDPRLYGAPQSALLSNAGGVGTGWRYSVPGAPGATWTAAVTAGTNAAAFNWAMTVLAFTPPAGAFAVTRWGYNNLASAPRTFTIAPNWGESQVNAGDVGMCRLMCGGPVIVTMKDTQGNRWREVPLSAVPKMDQHIFLCDTPEALTAADLITVTISASVQVFATVYGLHGLGPYQGAATAIGNSATPVTEMALPVQSAFILPNISSAEAAPTNAAEWTLIDLNTPGGMFGMVSYGVQAAAADAWPPPARIVRLYPRRYASAQVPNSAILVNAGNVPAPATALYTGPLGQSRLEDGKTGRVINVAALDAGMEIIVDTATLGAWGAGGATRASYILAGSQPLLVPAGDSATWTLYATGAGSVEITWRPAWH